MCTRRGTSAHLWLSTCTRTHTHKCETETAQHRAERGRIRTTPSRLRPRPRPHDTQLIRPRVRPPITKPIEAAAKKGPWTSVAKPGAGPRVGNGSVRQCRDNGRVGRRHLTRLRAASRSRILSWRRASEDLWVTSTRTRCATGTIYQRSTRIGSASDPPTYAGARTQRRRQRRRQQRRRQQQQPPTSLRTYLCTYLCTCMCTCPCAYLPS